VQVTEIDVLEMLRYVQRLGMVKAAGQYGLVG
jgi:hypothetical protein